MAADVLHNDYMDNVILWKTGSAVPLPPRYTIHLFVNDITPTCTSVVGDFVECTLAGYDPIAIPQTDWVIQDYPTPGSCAKQALAALYDFVFSAGGQTIYGLWVYDTENDLIAWTKRLGDPYIVPTGGGSIDVQPSIIERQTP